MFDNILKEIKKLEQGSNISVDLPSDEEGYFDRQCPSEPCKAEFKILEEDWEAKVKNEQVFCPICRYEAPADEWNTGEQLEYAEKIALGQIERSIQSALSEDARIFNRKLRAGFIQLSMSVKPGHVPMILPLDIANTMRQKFICEICCCRYASIGAAFFCPACGHNSAESMFDQTITTVRKIISQVSSIRSALTEAFDNDVAENSTRNMIEDSLGRLVGAFQHFVEALFDKLQIAASIKRRKNVFQNLTESSELWRKSIGKGYETMLSSPELQELEALFQKRHLLAHRNGIVDKEYIDKSGDSFYATGQRLVVQPADIILLTNILSRLSSELKKVT